MGVGALSCCDVPSSFVLCSIPPVISNIAPDRQNVSFGFLRVFIVGASFCDGMRYCGKVLLNGNEVDTVAWNHTEIMFVMPDLPQGGAATVQVVVGNQVSNTMSFSKPVPNINALVSQGSWTAMDTRGNQTMWIAGVLDLGTLPASVTIGGRPCTNLTRFVDNGLAETAPSASFTIVFFTPAGMSPVAFL